MKIIWTPHAMRRLKSFFDYYKEVKGVKFARKFRKKISDKIALLKNFPRLGKEVKAGETGEHEIRFLLEGVYKIFYRVDENESEIHIIEIFDTRQNPESVIL